MARYCVFWKAVTTMRGAFELGGRELEEEGKDPFLGNQQVLTLLTILTVRLLIKQIIISISEACSYTTLSLLTKLTKL